MYAVQYENQADLKVYKVKYSNQVRQNDGKWFFTDYSNQAIKKNIHCKVSKTSRFKNLFCGV
jgi:hypothetical protein